MSVALPHPALRWRSERSTLSVSGPDRRPWLQGQITNDLGRLKPGHALYALCLNARGKMVADVWVTERAEDFLLIAPESSRLSEHLSQYIVMEDVTLSPAGLDVVTVLGTGADAVAEAAEEASVRLPSEPLRAVGVEGWDLLVPSERRDAFVERLTEVVKHRGGSLLSDESWLDLTVQLALPTFGRDFGDTHYPAEAGLLGRAVSFAKGCYLGQEVVCMLKDRGQVSRRLVQLESESPPQPQSRIRVQDRDVGYVTSASTRVPAAVALGYVKRAHAKARETLHLETGTARVIQVVGDAGDR